MFCLDPEDFLLPVFPKSFIVFTFYNQICDALELTFAPALFVEKAVFAPLSCICTFVQNQSSIFALGRFGVLYFVPLIYMFIPLAIPQNIDYFSYVLSLDIR